MGDETFKPPSKAKAAKGSRKSAKPATSDSAPDLSLDRALGPVLGLMVPIALVVLFALFTWATPWWHGPRLRHPWNLADSQHLALALGGSGLAVCAFWIVLPVAHWLRCAPLERYRSGSRLAWLVPLLIATPAWMFLYVAAVGCMALGGYAAISGLMQFGVPELLRAMRG